MFDKNEEGSRFSFMSVISVISGTVVIGIVGFAAYLLLPMVCSLAGWWLIAASSGIGLVIGGGILYVANRLVRTDEEFA